MAKRAWFRARERRRKIGEARLWKCDGILVDSCEAMMAEKITLENVKVCYNL